MEYFQVHKCIVNFNIRISRKYIMNNVIQNEYYLNNYKSKKDLIKFNINIVSIEHQF